MIPLDYTSIVLLLGCLGLSTLELTKELIRHLSVKSRRMCTTSGVVGKKVACVCLDPPTLQAVLVVHTPWGVRFLFDYN